jgi:hypothetical protein
MNDQNKTKAELIVELQKTHQHSNALKATFVSNLKVIEKE